MKKYLLVATTLLLSSCGTNNNVENVSSEEIKTHECEHVCPCCGLCEDENCMEETCKNKCQGHVSYGFKGTINDIDFELKDMGEVSIHTSLQDQYLADDYNNSLNYTGSCTVELSAPAVIKLEFSTSLPLISSKKVYISEDREFSNPIALVTDQRYAEVQNLKIGTPYYWYVEAGGVKSGIAKFTTLNNAPRNLYIDKLVNFRDIGGWETNNGNVIKQGLLYRCGALNYNDSTNRIVSEQGIQQLKDLGIKCEIDLRGSSPTENGNLVESVIGPEVKYVHIGMVFGSLLENNAKEVAEVFHVLADKNNYPCVFHCAGGTDRTGMIAFLIEALCGVEYENLMKDYFFSNFYRSRDPRTINHFNSNKYYEIIQKAKGDSLALKTYNTLCSYGVSSDDIDAVMEILIEGFEAD